MTAESDWWINAITRMGHATVLIAFQEAKVPPEGLYDEVRKFRSADEFVAKVEEYMAALYEAKEDAKSLIKKDKKIKELNYKLTYVIELAKELARRLKIMENIYNLAVSNLDEEGLKKFVIAAPMVTGGTLQPTEEV